MVHISKTLPRLLLLIVGCSWVCLSERLPVYYDISPHSVSSPQSSNAGPRLFLALFDDAFKEIFLDGTGVRLVSRIGDVGVLEYGAGPAALIRYVPGVRHVSQGRQLVACLDSVRSQCNIYEVHEDPPTILSRPYYGSGVLLGIVDTDIDTRHPAFLDGEGTTRFIAVWDHYDSSGADQNRFGYGTIKRGDELVQDPAFGMAGGTHGTLSASYAASSDFAGGFVGPAPGAMLAFVRRGNGEGVIPNAIDWLFSLADSLDVPCVVNLSIGRAFGPHDGTSLVDRVIDSLSGEGRIVVGAMGNDGSVPGHVYLDLPVGISKGTWVEPVVREDSLGGVTTYSYLDVWGEIGDQLQFDILLIDTANGTTTTLASGFRTNNDGCTYPDTVYLGGGDSLVWQLCMEEANALNNKPRISVYTYYGSKASHWIGIDVAVRFGGGSVHAWNAEKRSLRSFGITGFYDGDSISTVNEVGGTANRIIAVGAYVSKNKTPLWDGSELEWTFTPVGELAGLSSRGPTVDGRIKPDICAPGEVVAGAVARDVPTDRATTVFWPDTTSTEGRYIVTSGTSVAAPIVAGAVALMLEIDPTLTPEDVRDILQTTAIQDEYTGDLSTHDNRWGAGKLDVLGAVSHLLGVTAPRIGLAERTQFTYKKLRIEGGTVRLLGAVGPVHMVRGEIVDMRGRRLADLRFDRRGMARLPADIPSGIHALYLYTTGKGSSLLHRLVFSLK